MEGREGADSKREKVAASVGLEETGEEFLDFCCCCFAGIRT